MIQKQMILLAVTLLVFLPCKKSYGQCSDWENFMAYKYSSINDLSRDRFGNLYLVGLFWTQDLTIGTTTLPLNGAPYSGFILKFDKNNNLIWSKLTAGRPEFVEIDKDDNIVVVGGFYDPSISFDCIQLINSSSRSDVFIVKFSQDGQALWGTQSKGLSDEWPSSLKITSSNEIVITGHFVASTVSFQEKVVPQFGGYDSFITSISAQGNVKWARAIGGPGSEFPDYIQAVAVDSEGNSIITGFFESPNIQIGSFSISSNAISENFFLAKLDPNGNFIWAKGLDTFTNVGGYDVITDHANNIYVTGRFIYDDVTFGSITLANNGEADVFLAKYDPDGNVLQAKNYGGDRWDSGLKLALDKTGNILLAGFYYSYLFSMDSFTISKSEFYGFTFLATLDDQLNVLCLKNTNGNGDVLPESLKVDSLNNILMTLDNLTGYSLELDNGLFSTDPDISYYAVFLGNNQGFDSAPQAFTFSFNLGQDTIICLGDSVVIDAGIWCGAKFLWQDGSNEETYKAKLPGLYWVEVNLNGTIARDTILIESYPPLIVDLGDDKIICRNEVIYFDVSQSNPAQYEWSDNTSQPVKMINAPGLFWVKVKNACGEVYDSINISTLPPPSADLGADKIICENETISLNPNSAGASSYEWNDNTSDPTKEIDGPGLYWVIVRNKCEAVYDSIMIEAPPILSVSLGEDKVICAGDHFSLYVNSTGASGYKWQDGSISDNLFVSKTGTYHVTVSNGCEFKSDTIQVSLPDISNMMIPNIVTADNNKLNDTFMIPKILEGSKLNIFNRWGEIVFSTNDYHNTWPEQNHPSGVYYFQMRGNCIEKELKGYIQLIQD